MGPKKKRKVTLPEKPGKARQYLEDNFQSVPSDNLKNGHVLFVFLQSKNSPTDTATLLKGKLTGKWKITKHQITNLVNKTLNKYGRNLSRESTMSKFSELCNEVFPLVPDASDPVIIPAPAVEPVPTTPKASTSAAMNDNVSPVRMSRRVDSTPRKQSLRKQLAFTSKARSSEKKVSKEKIKSLRQMLKSEKSVAKKHLVQQIKRQKLIIEKNKQHLSQVKRVLKSGALGEELAGVKKAHQVLKRYHKLRRQRTVPYETYAAVKKELKERDEELHSLQVENELLNEKLTEMSSETSTAKVDKKTYSGDTRMMVFECVTNNVPTKSVPTLMSSLSERVGRKLETVPHRTSVEMMVRELGSLSDFQVAEFLVDGVDLTLGFDATTQDGIHINSIHVTSRDVCRVVSVDELPGGTSDDYAGHISDSINRLVDVYSKVTGLEYNNVRNTIISNITNTMTDRAAVNHATVAKVEEMWGKKLNELNCHLHPLDTIASSCRKAMKSLQPAPGKVFGYDCMAANLILALNKMRFKEGKGDPKSFISFLDKEGLPRGLIERYRGNRLHVLFDLSAKYFIHYSKFVDFLTNSVMACVRLQKAVHDDFCSTIAKTQFQVLGLIGVLLSGPWMRKFYTSAETEINHIDGIEVVKGVMEEVQKYLEHPLDTLTTSRDFFKSGCDIDSCLLREPEDPQLFEESMKACLAATIQVLDRQYAKYLELDVTEQLRREAESARSHNMDAEEVMGMITAAKLKAPSATVDFLTCKLRAQKNQTVKYLDNLPKEEKDRLISISIGTGRKHRQIRKQNLVDIRREIQERLTAKVMKKTVQERNKIERTLRKANLNLSEEFPDLKEVHANLVNSILTGKVVGQTFCHVWMIDEVSLATQMYYGKVEKVNKRDKYTVAYWGENETYAISVLYDMTKYALAADLIAGDLTLA